MDQAHFKLSLHSLFRTFAERLERFERFCIVSEFSINAREQITVSGVEPPYRFTNQHLFIADPPVATPLAIGFDLAVQELVLKHRTRDIRVRLRGDEVVAADNFGADLTFFDPYD